MKIGTDVNLYTCRAEGYTVIEFKVADLFPNGRKAGIDKTHPVHVTQSFPERWTDSGKPQTGYEKHELYALDTYIDWKSAFGLYRQFEQGINKFAGIASLQDWGIDTSNPNAYDLLTIIDIVTAYCGI